MCNPAHHWVIPPLAEKNDEEGKGIALGHCRRCPDTKWFRVSHASAGRWEEGRHILYPAAHRPHRQTITSLAEERAR